MDLGAMVGGAMDRTRRVLFEPPDLQRYIVLAFCAWLANLGSVGGNAGSTGRDLDLRQAGNSLDDLQALGPLPDELQAVLPWIAAGLVVALLVITAVWLLIVFLRSRGAFLLLDGIVRERGAVVAPWTELAPQANALFSFRVMLSVGSFFAAFLGFGLVGGITWSTWGPEGPAGAALAAAVGVTLLVAVGLLAVAFIDSVLDEWVVPVMYARRCGVGEGFSVVRGLFGADPWAFILYVVVRVPVAVGAAVLSGVAVCLTCGLAAVPVLGTFVLLPLHVFVRSLALEFLGAVDPDLRLVLGPTSEPTRG